MGPIYHHESPWGDQYRQSVGFTFSTTQVPGSPIGLVSQSNYHATCNWLIDWWWGRDKQITFRVIFYHGRTWYNSFRVKLLSDLLILNTKWSSNVYISCSMLFSKIRMGGTSCHMKNMPVILLFSYDRDSLSNMWNLDWNPCMLIKWSNVMKAYTISVPTPVLHWLWWYIDTLEFLENKYLPIEFVRKDWEYPEKIFVIISHGCWDD